MTNSCLPRNLHPRLLPLMSSAIFTTVGCAPLRRLRLLLLQVRPRLAFPPPPPVTAAPAPSQAVDPASGTPFALPAPTPNATGTLPTEMADGAWAWTDPVTGQCRAAWRAHTVGRSGAHVFARAFTCALLAPPRYVWPHNYGVAYPKAGAQHPSGECCLMLLARCRPCGCPT